MSAQNTIERVFTLEKELQEFITDCRNREHSESYLISVLHKVQARYGFLSRDHMQEVAELLGIPASTVSGVATFYHFFRLQPQGKYKVSFCMGTACYVKGAPGIIDAFKEELGVDIGETTKDGLFSLEITRCLGVCGLAPVVMINETVHGKLTPASVPALIAGIRKKEEG
ncbi:MAG TPA: NADH-quinone oxidoreductase subunit NuoE [Spirochaetota bacterium]|nr:NADH-quinone oxidoreductase subunit NuoE [Spirochaetota bacterium]